MSLPKLNVPLYDVVCPSGIKVSFRPFLVKEEKLLMIAMQSKDSDTVLQATRQILENCVGKISNIDVDKLPLFDVEFLFLNLRARSIGEQVTLTYKCNQAVANTVTNERETCNAVSEYPVNLLDIKPVFGAGHTKNIQLNDEGVGVTLRYPTFKSFRSIARKDLPAEEAFMFLVECIESVYDTNTVVQTKDAPPEEVAAFVDDLSKKQIEKMDKFFDTMPKIEMGLEFKCPKCHYEEKITVKGLDNFFV